MRHLTAAEADADLDAVAVGEELLRVAQLGVEVADVDPGGHADLLDLHHMLILAGFLLLLALLEAEFAVVHQPAHRRRRLGRDLHEIQALFICDLQRAGRRHDAQLLAGGADQTDLLVADLLVQFMHYFANGRNTSLKNTKTRTPGRHPRTSPPGEQPHGRKAAMTRLINVLDLFA